MTVANLSTAPLDSCSTTWRPSWAVDLPATIGPLRRGGGDPTFVWDRRGGAWRTTRTPLGPATLHVAVRASAVQAVAWGPGAEWAIDAVPDLLGTADDVSTFEPDHPLVRSVHRMRPGLRIPRTGAVVESLVPTVIEQKVTGTEARRAWRWLVLRYGEPAPGPAPSWMRVPPAPETWARVPSWDWHRAGVDDKRASTILRAVRVHRRLEETTAMTPRDAIARLRALPGVGPWTAAEVAQRALGDADAVTVGDLHLPRIVGWAVAGRPFDDAAMLEFLAPYAPHRHRVVRLIELSGAGKPKFAPRYAVRDFRRM